MKTPALFATSPTEITALAREIMSHQAAGVAGRATYLRTLLANVQIELVGKPVLRALRGNYKKPDRPAVMAAFDKVQEACYEAVLAALPEGISADEKQSRTGFARSAASTLRRALKLGWAPLVALPEVSKGQLAGWIEKHRPAPRKPTLERVQRRVASLVDRIQAVIKGLPAADAQAVAQAAVAELERLAGGGQRLRDVSLRRHERQGYEVRTQ